MRQRCYRISFGILSLLAFLGSTSGIASAHVLKQNNGISAVLHIPPEDNPEANQATDLDFFFSDEQNRFSLTDCNCNVTVRSNGQTLQTVALKPAKAGDTVDAIATVHFPAIGIYDVIVKGNSRSGAFRSFKLDYLERVAVSATGNGQPTQNNSNQVLIISGASFLILIAVAQSLIRNGGRYESPGKHSKP